MHETPEEREARWNLYRSEFARRCRQNSAPQPDTDVIREYFDDAFHIKFAVGHYIIERSRAISAARSSESEATP